jgi:hypothetical protein
VHVTCQRFNINDGQRLEHIIPTVLWEISLFQWFPIVADSLISFHAAFWQSTVLRWRVRNTEPWQRFQQTVETVLTELGCHRSILRARPSPAQRFKGCIVSMYRPPLPRTVSCYLRSKGLRNSRFWVSWSYRGQHCPRSECQSWLWCNRPAMGGRQPEWYTFASRTGDMLPRFNSLENLRLRKPSPDASKPVPQPTNQSWLPSPSSSPSSVPQKKGSCACTPITNAVSVILRPAAWLNT